MKSIKINPKILEKYFDMKVREQCKSCKRFNTKNTCPNNIESFDYFKNLLPTYKYGIIYYKLFEIDNLDNWINLGKNSSLELHNFLLKERENLLNRGIYFNVAFTGGSCKLCDKCSFPCIYPNKALIPLEATGINIVKLMKQFGIKISFPVKTNFYRVGLLLWD